MSIERSNPHVSPKRAMDGVDPKHKPKPADETGSSPGPASFLSLLNTFGDEDGLAPIASDAPGPVSTLPEAGQAVPPPVAKSDGVAPEKTEAKSNAASTRAQEVMDKTTATAAPATATTPAATTATTATATSPKPAVADRPGVDGLPVAGRQALQVLESLADGAASVTAGGAPDPARTEPTDAGHEEHGLPAGRHDILGRPPGFFGRAVAARAVAAAMAERADRAEKAALRMGVADASPGPGGMGVALSGAAAEPRSTMGLGAVETKAHGAVTLELPVAAGTGGSGGAGEGLGGQSERRPSDRMNEPGMKAPVEGAWAGATSLEGVPQDFATVFADAGAPLEQKIAEQVRYWVANDVQNAELTLDGAGKDPVEISISLAGNEARVEFRTDRQEMRQVLEDAAARLKDMLASEGLLLTGVSVGASGANGAGARGHVPPREGVRRAMVAASAPVAVNPAGRPTNGVGRALDVFV